MLQHVVQPDAIERSAFPRQPIQDGIDVPRDEMFQTFRTILRDRVFAIVRAADLPAAAKKILHGPALAAADIQHAGAASERPAAHEGVDDVIAQVEDMVAVPDFIRFEVGRPAFWIIEFRIESAQSLVVRLSRQFVEAESVLSDGIEHGSVSLCGENRVISRATDPRLPASPWRRSCGSACRVASADTSDAARSPDGSPASSPA